jgi:protein-S-isoprenylcysteine O-methyltransferase Ste14
MKATAWEFANRAMVFGLIIGFAFFLYSFDHQNGTAVLANWLAPRLGVDAESLVRVLFLAAAALLAIAALIRTWASAYLQAGVVYASEVKSDSLVADGPYRWVRNPLYLANIVMAVGMGAMMSRTGFFLVVLAMLLFCYRLILREEGELRQGQGQDYQRYAEAVPRLFPSARARVASADRSADWAGGLKAELWYWGFAIAVAAFAVTLRVTVFFSVVGASIALFWVSSLAFRRKKMQP